MQMNETAEPTAEQPKSRLRRWFLPSWKQRKQTFAREAWFAVLVSYAAIILAFACPQDLRSSNAGYIWIALAAFMIRTLLFHLGLLLLLIAIVAGLMRRRWLLVAAVPLVAFTVGPAVWSYVPHSSPTVTGETITVMSVNLLHANTATDPIAAEVLAARPDVLALEEYTPAWHLAFQAALGDEYPYVSYLCRQDSFGQAVYARQPFVGPVDPTLRIGTIDVFQTRAVIRLAGREVALYNIHLLPPRHHGWFIEQRWEFADLIELLEREPLPVILCGDFNFTNASVFADRLDDLGLTDVHRTSGRGLATTWPVLGLFRYLPGLRLDHVFLSSELTSTSSRTGIGRGSDHRPVTAEVGFAQ